MSDGKLEWIGIVKVLDTLELVALRRTLVYDYSDFYILLHI
jgi:hypothetical protein